MASPSKNSRYRVVQWATGNIGMRSLRAVIEHPDYDLVGLYVYSDAKAGRDAGELCGAAPTGVIATKDIDEILALKPDCVLYMPDRLSVVELVRLLESGANVVTTRMELHHPGSLDPEVRERVEEACQRGGTSVYGTGASPGFISEVLPIALTSVQRRLDRLTIDEFADMSSRNSPEMIFHLLGFGRDPTKFDATRVSHHGAKSFSPSLRQLAEALGLPLHDIVVTGAVAAARTTVEIAAGTIEAGTVAAQRMEVTGLRGGKPLIVFRANWYCATDLEPAWVLRETGWRLLVEGDTPFDVNIRFPVPEEDYAATSPGYTAHRPVNAIPVVCAADPGIRTTVDMSQVIARLA
jgi:2,4-diaminopentanoate dehydrogenase